MCLHVHVRAIVRVRSDLAYTFVCGYEYMCVLRPYAQPFPLFFFSSFFFSWKANQFYGQLTFYAKRVRMVAYDMVGHGASESPAGAEHYTAESLMEDKLELFRQTCRGCRTVLVAHAYVSDGQPHLQLY